MHGFIRLDDTERRVVDSEPFQRLRGIHQLALARHVYPGATHSRFEHSLGVFHIASRICQHLQLPKSDRIAVTQAALLHDIGHGPFSHVSDEPLARYSSPEMLERAGGKPGKLHELLACDIIDKHPSLRTIRSIRRDEVAALIGGEHSDRLLQAILSGPLDADKQDYLLRDSLMCGVKYGVFDIDRLRQCLVSANSGEGRELRIAPGGVHAVEQFIIARYYSTTQIYQHRVRHITDEMLRRAVLLGVEVDGIGALRSLYACDGSEQFPRHCVQWDDWRLLSLGADSRLAETHFGQLFQRLRQRRLHKLVFSTDLAMLPVAHRGVLEKLPAHPGLREALEAEATAIIERKADQRADRLHVIVHVYEAVELPAAPTTAYGSVMVDMDPGPAGFDTQSVLLSSIERVGKRWRVDLYAPLKWRTPDEGKALVHSVAEPVYSGITEVVGSWTGGTDADGAA